jgi:uncharacterized membrane protein YfcA
MSLNVFLLLGMRAGIGVLSGLFGVGGGFLMTPLLLFAGVSPAVAVASQANQMVATSVSGVLAHWRRGNVDFKMGLILLIGGLAGSALGVWLYSVLRDLGQLDLVISLSYVLFLGAIGGLMAIESGRAILRKHRPGAGKRKLHQHTWLHGLPLKTRFRKSKLYISALLPLGIGFLVGILTAIMGVGGGFIMAPAMIYLLGMPTITVIGTSLFQIIFVAANVTFLQAVQNHTVDVAMALILLTGSVIGAQFGSRFAGRLPAEQLRGLLALLALLVSVKIVWGLVTVPADVFSLGVAAGG